MFSPDRARAFTGSPIWHTRLLVMGNDKLYIAFQNHNDKIRFPPASFSGDATP